MAATWASRGPAVSPAQLQAVAFETAGDRLLTGRAGLNFQDPAESGPAPRLTDWMLWVQDPWAGGRSACCSRVTAGGKWDRPQPAPVLQGRTCTPEVFSPVLASRPRGCPVAQWRQASWRDLTVQRPPGCPAGPGPEPRGGCLSPLPVSH